MTDQIVTISTSLSKDELAADLDWAVSTFNKRHPLMECSPKSSDISVSESHGMSGSEVVFFLGSAVASGIAYDVLKTIVLDFLVPRLNRKFGAGTADFKK